MVGLESSSSGGHSRWLLVLAASHRVWWGHHSTQSQLPPNRMCSFRLIFDLGRWRDGIFVYSGPHRRSFFRSLWVKTGTPWSFPPNMQQIAGEVNLPGMMGSEVVNPQSRRLARCPLGRRSTSSARRRSTEDVFAMKNWCMILVALSQYLKSSDSDEYYIYI